MKTIFVDSNLFLQCRDIKELPWSDISPHEEVHLLISDEVIKEIDRLKYNGSDRRSKRARKANSLFRALICDAENNPSIIREREPRVIISLSPLPPQQCKGETGNADDRIIDEALAFKTANPGSETLLLTHDTRPLRAAKQRGLDVHLIPDEWLLPPEPDKDNKRIIELEDKMKRLETLRPEVKVEFLSGQTPMDSVSLAVADYSQISETQLDELVTRACAFFPLQNAKVNALLEKTLHKSAELQHKRYIPPSEPEIRKYREEEYPAWRDTVRRYFANLAGNLSEPSRVASLHISIANAGSAPADNVLVEVRAVGGIELSRRKEQADAPSRKVSPEDSFPPVPRPPKGKMVEIRDPLSEIFTTTYDVVCPSLPMPLSNLERLSFPDRRDRNAFYWKNGHSLIRSTIWELSCDEFIHHGEGCSLRGAIHIPVTFQGSSAAITCKITARNLPIPIQAILPVRISYHGMDTMAEALSIIEKRKPPEITFGSK